MFGCLPLDGPHREGGLLAGLRTYLPLSRTTLTQQCCVLRYHAGSSRIDVEILGDFRQCLGMSRINIEASRNRILDNHLNDVRNPTIADGDKRTTSRMNREVHVRICEGLGVKFPGPTRPI